MYLTTLLVHSWFRWVVVVLAVLALGRAVRGWVQGRTWTPDDAKMGLLFAVSLDIQVLVGLALYFGLSPFTSAAMENFGAAMKDPVLRFWAVEHVFLMVLAMALAHVGLVVARKKGRTAAYKSAAIFWGLAVLSVVAAIPWPMRAVGRPLFRLP